jgi:acyl-CoA synthetase (AMP-forming)/AMP-acid ligase II
MIKHKSKSIGKAIPDVEVIVMNEDGDECPPGQIGELVHRGGCLTKGYWNAPEETNANFCTHRNYPGELLLFSGDLVKKDEDGYLYFIGRKDTMIKTSGYRVSPTEVEEEALKHSDVESVVVFGMDNIDIGQDIILGYTTVSGNPIPEDKYKALLKDLLPNYMVPRIYKHYRQFPVTGNGGKIDRAKVIEKYFSDLELLSA